MSEGGWFGYGGLDEKIGGKGSSLGWVEFERREFRE